MEPAFLKYIMNFLNFIREHWLMSIIVLFFLLILTFVMVRQIAAPKQVGLFGSIGNLLQIPVRLFNAKHPNI